MIAMKTILITGATGNQGGATVNALLGSPEGAGLKLIALTRNKHSVIAEQLAEQGVTLVQGNLNDCHALFKQELKDEEVWGVFSVQNPGINKAATETEKRQGKALIDAAIEKKVRLFVYASVDRGGAQSLENATPVAQFASKYDIENYLIERAGDMNWVILRPTTFMENLTVGLEGKIWASAYKHVMKNKPLHLISTKDIGKVAAKIFVDPEKYFNMAISLAGDQLTFSEADRIFREKAGKSMATVPKLALSGVMVFLRELNVMFNWFASGGYNVDSHKCQREWGLTRWEEWVEKDSPFGIQRGQK